MLAIEYSGIFLLQQDGRSASWFQLALIGLMIAFFYFFIILPQQKRQKKEREFQNNLKIGDMVITIGGIYGKVVGLEDKLIYLQVDENTRLKVSRQAIREIPSSETK
ncbi:MAG: preprotein translocase subunit YajC [Bacteroidia bacterium]|nr:preprotein translocase subunit YajC [Bacteroidia bacterium]MDW8158941.1 preprotein translocase subunit YajC [Bacteroidia bacterium]